MLKHRAGGGWLAVHGTWVLKIWNGGNKKKNANTITWDDVWDSLILSADSTVRPRAGSTSLYWTVLPREEQTSIVRPPAVTREVEWQVGKLMTYLEKLEQGQNTADLHSHTHTMTAVGIWCILLQWGGSWMCAEAGAGCQNTREWGIRFPESSGLNHNLADRFRENKKFKVVFE